MTTRMMSRQSIVAIVVTCCALGLPAKPASAAPSTNSQKPYEHRTESGKPYDEDKIRSTNEYCHFAVCEVNATADHENGDLALDVKYAGTKGVWFGCWPICSFAVTESWFWTSSWFFDKKHVIPRPVSSISITVEAETRGASASATGQAGSWVQLAAAAYPPSTCGCQSSNSSTSVLLASSNGQTSGTTHTLTFTVRGADGGKIPAGEMPIVLSLQASGGGAGSATVNASATILSVSSVQN